MPYARVSAMPQPTEEADGSVSSKGKGSIRGITIQVRFGFLLTVMSVHSSRFFEIYSSLFLNFRI